MLTRRLFVVDLLRRLALVQAARVRPKMLPIAQNLLILELIVNYVGAAAVANRDDVSVRIPPFGNGVLQQHLVVRRELGLGHAGLGRRPGRPRGDGRVRRLGAQGGQGRALLSREEQLRRARFRPGAGCVAVLQERPLESLPATVGLDQQVLDDLDAALGQVALWVVRAG